jgi:WD40 repeat protein
MTLRFRTQFLAMLVCLAAMIMAKAAEPDPLPDGAIARLGAAPSAKKEDAARAGHTDAICMAAFSPDGKKAATASRDGDVLIWEAETGKLLHRIPTAGRPKWGPDGLAFSGDGRTLLALSDRLRSWGAASGEERANEDASPEKDWRIVALSPDARLMVVAGPNGAAGLWDVSKLKEIRKIQTEGKTDSPLGWVAYTFSADGTLLAAVGHTNWVGINDGGSVPIRVWRINDGGLARSFEVPHTGGIHEQILLGPDGRTAVVAAWNWVSSSDWTLGLECGTFPNRYDRETKAHIQDALIARGMPGFVPPALAMSPDGQLLAAGDFDNDVRLWETATCREILRWKGHGGRVTAAVFAPDGKTLLTGAEDGSALLWDVTGRLTRRDPPRTAKEKDVLWADLSGEDAARAHDVVQTLAAAPGEAVPLFRERLKAVTAAEPRRVSRWIADLNDDEFAVREKATAELTRLGAAVAAALRDALDDKTPPEMRLRIEGLLAKQTSYSAEQVRSLRAIRALEWMGTDEARQVLRVVAKGAPGAVETEAARAALKDRPPASP